MKYEVGQKVETPLGVGVIFVIQDKILEEDTNKHYYKVEFPKTQLNFLATFTEDEVKPYKTPHEKLIEMGYEYKEHEQGHRYIHKKNKDYIDIDLLRSSYYHFTFKYERHYRTSVLPSGTTLELSRILTDYLEWLEEEE